MIEYRQPHRAIPVIAPVASAALLEPSLSKPKAARSRLLCLSLGNLVIGTGTMIIAGLLDIMAADLHTPVAAIGQLITGYGFAVCFGAPVLASLTSRYSRRQLLVAALVLFAVGNLSAAWASSYALLMTLRILTGFGAAVFTPQAAATASLLVPSEQRGRAIATVYLGFSVANVLGTPVGIMLGGAFGWRVALGAIGVLAAVCAVVLWPQLPAALYAPPLDRSAWRAVFRSRALSWVLATTFLVAAAQFVLIAYLAVVFRVYLGADAAMVGLLFAWVGVFGVVGNMFCGSLIDRVGSARVVMITMLLMLGGMLLWPLTRGSLPFTLLALGLWGLGTFACNSAQQARLASLAPRLAPASIALNSSAFYLGQSAGAAIGGASLASFGMDSLSWVGVATLLLGFAATGAATRPVGVARQAGAGGCAAET